MNKKNTIYILLIIIGILLTIIIFMWTSISKESSSPLKSITLLGNTVELEEDTYIYHLNWSEAYLKYKNNTCEYPIAYSIDSSFPKSYSFSNSSNIKNGSDHISFSVKYEFDNIGTYEYFFDITLKKPLEIDEECR